MYVDRSESASQIFQKAGLTMDLNRTVPRLCALTTAALTLIAVILRTVAMLTSFDAEIGIPTVPYQKQERMVNAEAQSKSIDAKARCEMWVEMFNSSADRVKKVTGIECSAKIRYEGGDLNGADTGDDQRLQSSEVLQ